MLGGNPVNNINRVISGGLFALFAGLIFQALTLFGVISVLAGHIAIVTAWIVGSVLIATEILLGRKVGHKAIWIVSLGMLLLALDLWAMHVRHGLDVAGESQSNQPQKPQSQQNQPEQAPPKDIPASGPTPAAKSEQHPARRPKPIPAGGVAQSGKSNGAVNGNISQGPCSNLQIGGNNNSASTNCVNELPARTLSDAQLTAMLPYLVGTHARLRMFNFTSGDSEAAALFGRIRQLLTAAHWEGVNDGGSLMGSDIFVGVVIQAAEHNNGSAKALQDALQGCNCGIASVIIPTNGLGEGEIELTIGKNTDKEADLLLGGVTSTRPR